MEGWLKLHRKIQDHWLYEKNRPKTKYEAWLHILMNVNYKSGKSMIRGVVYECNPGQCLFSLETWAKHFNWSVQMVRTFIAQLKKDEMITTEGMQYTTRLTICNWATYQGDATDEKQTEQQADNKPLTDEQQTANRRLTIIEEVNKVNKVKKVNNSRKISEISEIEISTPSEKITFNFWKLFNEIMKDEGVSNSVLQKAVFEKWDRQTVIMIEKNECSLDQLRDIYRWLKKRETKNSKFWAANVRSMNKLREKIPTILMQMKLEAGPKNVPIIKYEGMETDKPYT